jgi:hypothetical protein
MNQFYPLQLSPESIDAVIFALRKLPHEQVHDLVMDIATQRDQYKAALIEFEKAKAMPEVEAE